MKRLWSVLLLCSALALLVTVPIAAERPGCNDIKSGLIVYPDGHYWEGEAVGQGYDAYGYNYGAHRFSGWYVNAYLGFEGLAPYEGDYDVYIAENPGAEDVLMPGTPYSLWLAVDLELDIKWNDAYRSRTDCDGDGWFDRHPGFDGYAGSGAWYSNHVSGELFGEPVKEVVKVVAVPADAELVDGIWYTADGQEIGLLAEECMALTFDLYPGDGFYYKGLPGLGRW